MLTALMVVTAVALVLVAFWPRRGVVARWRAGRRFAIRVQIEDALKQIHKCEVNGQVPTLDGVAGALRVSTDKAAQRLAEMEERGLVSHDRGHLRLRQRGRDLALHLIRAHRLWESYLAEQTGVAEAEWHPRADRQEHLLSPQQTEALSARLGHPARDPHGDAIPNARDDSIAEAGQPLTAVAVNAPVLITHIEDEPGTIYAQLVAQGLRVGMKACVLEKTPHRIRLWAEGEEHVLAPILANNISVAPLPELQAADLFEEQFLSSLKPGERARVLELSPACRGAERRRLLDLGLVAGTTVAAEMVSPGGDPTAYRVRGALIALRREQANLVRITKAAEIEAVAA